MRYLAAVILITATGCGHTVDVPISVTSRAPNATFACIAPRIRKLPVRTSTQATSDGWLMNLQVFAGPPSGWYSKGRIEHTGGTVLYAPDSATLGIGTPDVAAAVRPILNRCSR